MAKCIIVYFSIGMVASHVLPLVELPNWAIIALSYCFEPVFVTLFGQW